MSIFALAYFQGRVDLLGLTPPGTPATVQPRLAVGPSDDPAEREADRMAEWVVSGHPRTPLGPVRYALGPLVQRDDGGPAGSPYDRMVVERARRRLDAE